MGRTGRVLLMVVTIAGFAAGVAAQSPPAPIAQPVSVATDPAAYDPEDPTTHRRVLIVGSYERYVSATSKQEAQIREALEKLSRTRMTQVRADYLVSGVVKTPESTPETRTRFVGAIASKWGSYQPHLVVVIDTLAFDVMTSPEAKDLFPGVPIVFSGVVWEADEIRARAASCGKPMTGVIERMDLHASIALIRKVQPNLQRLLVIIDPKARSAALRTTAEKQLAKGVENIELKWCTSDSLAGVLDEAAAMGPGSAGLYLAYWPAEPSSTVLGLTTEWPIPVYPVFESNVGLGMTGGLVLSPEAQGIACGQLATRVLMGERASDIPFVTDADKRVVLRYPQLARWGFVSNVPPGAILLDEPKPWTERHGKWLIWVPVVALVQAVIIGQLLLQRARMRRAEQQLLVSEQRYALALMGSTDGLWDWDIPADRTYWSSRTDDMLGYSAGELNAGGITWTQVLHPDDTERAITHLKRHLEDNERYDIQYRLRRRDGSYRWFRSRGVALRDKSGRPVRMAGSIVDVQELVETTQQMRASEERFRAIFDKHPYPTWVYDMDTYRFLAVNNAAIRKYGYSREEFLELTVLDVRPESERQMIADLLKTTDPDAALKGVWVHHTKEGRLLDVSITTHTIPWEGTKRARVATIIDVTDQVRDERLQERQRTLLENIAADRPLEMILREIVRLVQERFPETVASVILLDEDGCNMRTAVAPDLPQVYNEAVNGMQIGPRAGSCGTAMFLGERVVAEDIATDERWEIARTLALEHGLRACWSDPIRTSDGGVVGSLALYYRQPQKPSPEALEVISTASHLAGIAIQRDRTQRALRESEARYRQIVETAEEGIWMTDALWRTTFVNARMASMLGWTAESMIGRHLTEFMDDEGRSFAEEAMKRREMGTSERHEFKFVRKDGTAVWTALAANPLLDEHGRFGGALAMVTDITARRETELALRRERRLFLSGPAIAWRWRSAPGWPVEYVSENVSSLGYSPEDFMSERVKFADIVHPDDLARVAEEVAAHVAAGQHGFEQEYRIRTSDGRWRWIADHTVIEWDGREKPAYFAGHTIDVTERVTAERALAESEAAHRALISAIPDVIFRIDAAGRYRACYASETARLLAPRDAFLGRTPREVLPRHLAEQCHYHLDQLFATGQTQTYEYEVRREDGSVMCYEVRMTRTEFDDAILLVRNVTDQRVAERKLRASEQRLSLLIESVPVGLISWDLDFIVTAWNPGAERLFGYTAREAIGRHGSFIVPPNVRPSIDEVWRSILNRTGGERGSNENVRKDGKRIICDWYNSRLVDGAGRLIGVASIVEDVTELRSSQQRQSLIMAELDHRVKNNLAAVLSLAEQTGRSADSYAEFLKKFTGRLRAMSRMHSALARSKWQGADLRTLVGQTLEAFSPGETDRLSMSGPNVTLPSRAAQGMAMALNELATNAAKYGALSGPAGSVDVAWTVVPLNDRDIQLTLTWSERGGPPVMAPTRRGFGSELIEGAIAHELRGEVELDFQPEGMVCRMQVQLEPDVGPV